MKGISIIVIRWNGAQMKGSKPCKHCCYYMKTLGVKKIMYSNDSGEIIKEKVNSIENTHMCVSRKYLGDIDGF